MLNYRKTNYFKFFCNKKFSYKNSLNTYVSKTSLVDTNDNKSKNHLSERIRFN